MAVKPLKTIQFPNSADTYEIFDETARAGLEDKANKDTILSYTIATDMFTGDAFPYTCAVAHGLGAEPSNVPLVDLDMSTYESLEDLEAAESSYGAIYRVTFDANTMTLYAKEIPGVDFKITVKVAM